MILANIDSHSVLGGIWIPNPYQGDVIIIIQGKYPENKLLEKDSLNKTQRKSVSVHSMYPNGF